MIEKTDNLVHNAKNNRVQEFAASSRETTQHGFSNHSNNSLITSSSAKDDNEFIDGDNTSDFDYAAEMKHFEPNHSNLTYKNKDQLMPIDENETMIFDSKLNHPSINTTFQEIERHLQKKKAMGKRLKGKIKKLVFSLVSNLPSQPI